MDLYCLVLKIPDNGTLVPKHVAVFFTFVWPCIVTNFFIIKPTGCTNFTNLFWHETLHVRTVRLSIIRSLFTVHSAMVYVYKPVRHIPLLSVEWINSWLWWTDKLSETCRFSCQDKFVKLVHLVGFIIKKFIGLYNCYGFYFIKCIYWFIY
jgi:hypothetical protein